MSEHPYSSVNLTSNAYHIFKTIQHDNTQIHTISQLLQDITNGDYDHFDRASKNKHYRIKSPKNLTNDAQLKAKELGYNSLSELLSKILEQEFS